MQFIFERNSDTPPESSFYDKSKLVRAIVLAMQYRYFDFALEIAQTAYHHRKLSESEFREIESVINPKARSTARLIFAASIPLKNSSSGSDDFSPNLSGIILEIGKHIFPITQK
jgi:hypothetical protein